MIAGSVGRSEATPGNTGERRGSGGDAHTGEMYHVCRVTGKPGGKSGIKYV